MKECWLPVVFDRIAQTKKEFEEDHKASEAPVPLPKKKVAGSQRSKRVKKIKEEDKRAESDKVADELPAVPEEVAKIAPISHSEFKLLTEKQ